MHAWSLGVLVGATFFLIGMGVSRLAIRRREARSPGLQHPEPGGAECQPEPLDPRAQRIDPSRLAGLVAETLRKPLARLRRLADCPPEVREPLERLATQLRLLDARPRPMQAKAVSPILLLQDVAEEVDLLRTGAVGISWSLRTREPVLVDPERAHLGLRELLEACAQGARTGGKVGVRVLGNPDPERPVRIEIELGRRFAEVDPLALLVAQHLLETQGGRVEADARVTRIMLRGPEKEEEAS